MRPARPIFPDIDFTAPSSSSTTHFHPRAKGNVTFVTYAPRGLLSSLCAKARRVEREREREVSSLLVPQFFLLLHFPFIPPLSLTSRSAPLTNRRPRIASPRAIVASNTCSHAGGAISSGIRPMFVRRDEERDF